MNIHYQITECGFKVWLTYRMYWKLSALLTKQLEIELLVGTASWFYRLQIISTFLRCLLPFLYFGFKFCRGRRSLNCFDFLGEVVRNCRTPSIVISFWGIAGSCRIIGLIGFRILTFLPYIFKILYNGLPFGLLFIFAQLVSNNSELKQNFYE